MFGAHRRAALPIYDINADNDISLEDDRDEGPLVCGVDSHWQRLQDKLAMSRATHLADLAAARSFKSGELATMVAFMTKLTRKYRTYWGVYNSLKMLEVKVPVILSGTQGCTLTVDLTP